ncbi:transmembrane amino acid transporter protein domain-containing protein [Ditylenchus destructor]|uniref:Transmembrane amino acid transporter protein domain-containing protein n=1 Tax=Ditylenchus destructor TaxID=166010 RepID=A0AAD4MYC5_9BILA|nr:transmembrane amino acid transporter protein domain-containing protein [Ditylenchus destructor]
MCKTSLDTSPKIYYVQTPENYHLGDYYERKGNLVRRIGMHWILASFLICADIAGSGIVALPIAITRFQFWSGMIFLILAGIAAVSSAIMLGESWVILLRRFPVYRTHTRKPYSELALRALGPKMRAVVSSIVNIGQFGSTTVFILLSAKNLADLLRAFFRIDIGFCWAILFVALFLFPITLLKSPKDFWWVIVGGMLSTLVAMFLIISGSVLDYGDCAPSREMPKFNISNMLMSFGTILFTYGGHAAFPTVQHDMKNPAHFRRSALLAITTVSILNMFLSTASVVTYGDSLRDSVINSIQTFWMQQALNIMITAHCLMTVTLIINPLNQSIEELFRIPQSFTIKRVVVRAGTIGMCVFVAETIPNFGSIMDLIGGSTITATSFTLPCVFYLYLSAGAQKAQDDKTAFDEPLRLKEWGFISKSQN